MSTTYEPVIGLEIHARIATDTKLFCRCKNEAVPSSPNVNVCPICMGFPGMLPKLNQKAVDLAIRASLALGMTVDEHTMFDRKNYFYPDLPMGYQISQFDRPLGSEGHITIGTPGTDEKSIGIERLHMENDAGKLSHYVHGSFVDFNRSGAPLMEIVSKPELHSIEDASNYAKEMQQVLRAVGASDCDMEKGQMRFDLNISLHIKGEPFGTKVEVKNLNSFKSLEKAIAFEITRQTQMLNAGETISQETRGWDDDKEKTVGQRSKEEAADYRYFREPDITSLSISRDSIEKAKASLPELPFEKKRRYLEVYHLDLDHARLLTEDHALSAYFEQLAELTTLPKKSAFWISTVVLALLNEEKISLAKLNFSIEDLAQVISYVENDSISHLNGKETVALMHREQKPAKQVIDEQGFIQISDTSALESIVTSVISEFPSQVEEYRSGKEQLIGFFVGQVMKASKGSANPKVVAEMLKNAL